MMSERWRSSWITCGATGPASRCRMLWIRKLATNTKLAPFHYVRRSTLRRLVVTMWSDRRDRDHPDDRLAAWYRSRRSVPSADTAACRCHGAGRADRRRGWAHTEGAISGAGALLCGAWRGASGYGPGCDDAA